MLTAVAAHILTAYPAPKLTLIQRRPPAHALPFVQISGDTVDFWSPVRSGDYGQDCSMGRVYAQALLQHMEEHNDQVVFGSIVRAIAQHGRYEAVEIGFCARLGFALCGFVGSR